MSLAPVVFAALLQEMPKLEAEESGKGQCGSEQGTSSFDQLPAPTLSAMKRKQFRPLSKGEPRGRRGDGDMKAPYPART